MKRQEAVLQSPLRYLDIATQGGLGRGHLGVIVAPPGVGKSACLVEIGLDALLRERSVLHVALGQATEHVSATYDAHFEALAERVDLVDRRGVHEVANRHRLIWSMTEAAFFALGLDEAVAAFEAHLGASPKIVLVDGFSWSGPSVAAAVGAVRATAARVGAEIWMTACEARPGELGTGPAPFSDARTALADVVVLLEPDGRRTRLTLVKHREDLHTKEALLALEGGALRTPGGEEEPAPLERSPERFTLLASGSAGAEEEFGACAERWGVGEVNFTFAGRGDLSRTRGLVELSEDELRLGEVSRAYVKVHLHRALGDSADLRRVLETIWHQVSRAGEVFSVGSVNDDKTVRGGTGWAVELAKHWGKPVHLFEQERQSWFRWDGRDWVPEAPPAITSERFAGAGTRFPTENARAAIRALFERSFGEPRS